MTSYKELGLVNTKDMFAKAVKGGYAIPAYNFNNMEQLQAIIMACVETKSPVILQVSRGARDYANINLLRNMARGAHEYAIELGCDIPIVLHLDHGDSFETCKECIDNGFSSVMIDGSSLPYEENIAVTKKVVEYAHKYDVTVEGELGVLAGIEDEVSSAVSHYTQPSEVIDFVSKTGVDSLAISIGTSHGANKFTPDQCTRNADGILIPPPLRFDILAEIEKKLPGFPIVLHGSSSVPQEFVKMINENGGKLKFSKRNYAGGKAIKAVTKTLSDQQKKEYNKSLFVQTPFRAWKSPYSGTVQIDQKVQSKSGENVKTLLFEGGSSVPSEKRSGVYGVTQGKEFYFITDTGDDTRDKDVNWNIQPRLMRNLQCAGKLP